MELKDVILSTLAEMEDIPSESVEKSQTKQMEEPKKADKKVLKQELDNESVYLNSIRDRFLVLFEGFQAPNNVNIEAKVDLTLNFLEYILATIDSRLDSLEKGNTK